MAVFCAHSLTATASLPPFNLLTTRLSKPSPAFSPLLLNRRSLTISSVATPSSPPAPTEEDNFDFPELEGAFSSSSLPSSSSDTFSWRDHWYPVSLIEDLDSRMPTPFQLLNRDIVLWKDPKSGDWIAFDDRCPHRLAPLSEGRIDENGCLQCSYHGWSFDRKGFCVRIPQAMKDGPEARAVQSPKACVTRLPTRVSQGLLFVWPDEHSWEKAMASETPRLPADFESPDFSKVTMQRDLFYGYDTLMENISDPSHHEFAHHKVTGRRDRAKPLPFKLEYSSPSGFAGAISGNPCTNTKFVAPCLYMNKMEIDTKLPIFGDQKWVIWVCFFNIPMAPGKTRSIVCSARNFLRFKLPGPAWWQLVPRWHEHWNSNKVFDGDMIVLRGQEKVFLSKSMEASVDVNQLYSKITFTPTQADRLVLAFRYWLRCYGNGQPDWFGFVNQQSLPSTTLSKHEMLNRYEQHTLKCSSCKGAYEGFRNWEKLIAAATVILCASVGIPSKIQLRLLLAASALVSAALAYFLHEIQKNFVFVDYVHAEID